MAIPRDIKDALTKVFDAIRKDQGKLTDLPAEFGGKRDERAYTVENLENIAANHLFDHNPNIYGLTELEGSKIRAYFQRGADTYDFIRALREEFPYFFGRPESGEYLESANDSRRGRGLNPISL